MSEPTFAEAAKKLHEDIAQTRQTLRDEHFPYEEGKSAYSALHEALRVMHDFMDTFVQWAALFPGREPNPDEMMRFRTIDLIHDGIKRELG